MSKKDQFGVRKKYSSTLTFKNVLEGESGVLFCEYESPNLTSYNDNIYIHVVKGNFVSEYSSLINWEQILYSFIVFFKLRVGCKIPQTWIF